MVDGSYLRTLEKSPIYYLPSTIIHQPSTAFDFPAGLGKLAG
jgi:hypothetical protein